MSPIELETLRRQIAELLEKGLIEPSTASFGAPCLFTTKKDTTELRLVIDYRRLNALSEPDRGLLPRIDDAYTTVREARVFSAIDLTSGYHQIRLPEEDVTKTSFRTPLGLFQFKVLPFGLRNAPQTFQAVTHKVLGPCSDYCLAYMDDLLVFSKTPEEHVGHVRSVLERLRAERLYAKPRKCHWGKTRLRFLGHSLCRGPAGGPRQGGCGPRLGAPYGRVTVALFLWSRKLFQDLGARVVCIGAAAVQPHSQGCCVELDSPACQLAFDGMKQALTEAAVLAQPDFSADAPGFDVWCDASDFGTGAVLLQGGRVIAFDASSFHDTQRRYTTGKKELLAVVRALSTWRCYLEGGKAVKVMTDHAPNTYLPTQPNLSRRQARWSEFLQRFNTLTWHYKPGKINVADPVSRSPALLNASAVDLAAQQWRAWLERSGGTATAAATEGSNGKAVAHLAGASLATPIVTAVESAESDVAPGTSLLDRVRAAYVKDAHFDGLTATPECALEDGLWKHGVKGTIIVPADNDLRNAIIQEAHATPACGHMGMNVTSRPPSPLFHWGHGDLKMRDHVEAFIRKCESCQRNKSSNQKPGGLLGPLPVPEGPWLSIGVDFVTGLPLTLRGKHDLLMTVVDRVAKGVHLVPTHKSLTAEGAALLLFDHVYRHHGLPDSIVSDRDKLFTGKFFPALQKLLGTRQRMSTGYHPETDGQTERANRVLQ